MATSLPPDPTTSSLTSSYEAIALLVHAYLTTLSFRLVGLQENKPLPESASNTLPPTWNDGFGSLSFVYKHKQSAMTFVFKIDKIGAKVEVRGLAVGAENIYRFERSVRDVVDSKKLPVKLSLKEEDGTVDHDDLVEKLRGIFVSEGVITGIIDDLRTNIVQKLIPKLQSEDYEETAEAEENARQERRQQEAQGSHRPFNDPPVRPYPQPPHEPMPEMARPRPPLGDFPSPGFDDEYDMNRPPGRAGGLVMPGRSPFNIGHDDLHPPGLGPHDPLRGSFTPGGGLPRPGGGGMHPTFDDPLFTGQGGYGGDHAPGGYDPQAPPGARWDPLGPGGGPRLPPGGGRGGNPFGGFGGGDII